MNQNAQDLMMKAPSEVDDKQLKELGYKNRKKKKINFLFSRFILTSERSTSFSS